MRALSDGPVLMSYLLREQGSTIPESRAQRLGLRLGRSLSGARFPEREGDRISTQAGYCHYFTKVALTELAVDAGYRIQFHTGPFAHATLIPAGKRET